MKAFVINECSSSPQYIKAVGFSGEIIEVFDYIATVPYRIVGIVQKKNCPYPLSGFSWGDIPTVRCQRPFREK